MKRTNPPLPLRRPSLRSRTRPAALVALAIAVLCFCAFAVSPPAPLSARAASSGGGPEIIHLGGGSADAVCVAVAVPVGSADEPPGMRGACHLIEHLAFDGSERFSREEMSRWVDDTGSFLNAFTRKETTVYFLVTSPARFEEGLEILSQMLLHSVFPAAEIEKERSVILEEMRREADDPRSSRERGVERALYRGSALVEPISGYPASIEAMNAGDLEAFYRRRYDPAGMRIVLMGGYDPGRATGLVRDYFGASTRRPAGSSIAAAAGRGRSLVGEPPVPRWGNEIIARNLPGEAAGFDMIVRLPGVPESDFPAALLVSRLLESEDSPLARSLAARSLPAPETGLEIAGGFSALRIHVACPDSLAEACGEVPSLVSELAEWRPDPASVEKAKTAFLSSEALDREMFHFYIMARGEAIALHGERYLEQVSDGVARVGAKDCARVLERCFREPRWNACLVNAPKEGYSSRGGAGEASAFEALPGGGAAAASTRPGSSAAAVHLAFRGRACAADGRAPGLVELLMTVLESSPAGKALARDLEALGARVAFGDNPYVPQDDYLLSPAFAFIRLEAPAARIVEAVRLLGSFLAADAVSDEALDEARAALMGELGMRSGSPLYMMRGSMMKALFGDHPFASPVFPPPPSMAGATTDDLRSLRARFFARGNVVATIVSPYEGDEALSILAGLVERLPPGPAVECPALPDSAAPGIIEKKTRKEGAYLAACWLVRTASPAETGAAMVAGEILGRRMQLELREKRGLAYTIDCGVSPLPGGAVVMAYLGTGALRFDEARAALEEEIRGLAARPPGDEEIAIARNRLLGRRSRSGLSSINSAYALGLDIVLGTAASPAALASAIAETPRGDVGGLIERSCVWERAVEIRLLPEKRSP